MPVGLCDASYSLQNSLLLAQTNLANNIFFDDNSQCITWTLFPKIVGVGESKNCLLKGAIPCVELLPLKKLF